MWPKRSQPDATSDNPASSMCETVSESEVRVNGVDSSIPSWTETSSSGTGNSATTSTESMSQPDCSACILPCCTDPKPFQPINSVVLASLANKCRSLMTMNPVTLTLKPEWNGKHRVNLLYLSVSVLQFALHSKCDEVVNELICMMGQSVLRKLLCNIKRVTPHWFGIIADEATDVSNRTVELIYKVGEWQLRSLKIMLGFSPSQTQVHW